MRHQGMQRVQDQITGCDERLIDGSGDEAFHEQGDRAWTTQDDSEQERVYTGACTSNCLRIKAHLRDPSLLGHGCQWSVDTARDFQRGVGKTNAAYL